MNTDNHVRIKYKYKYERVVHVFELRKLPIYKVCTSTVITLRNYMLTVVGVL